MFSAGMRTPRTRGCVHRSCSRLPAMLLWASPSCWHPSMAAMTSSTSSLGKECSVQSLRYPFNPSLVDGAMWVHEGDAVAEQGSITGRDSVARSSPNFVILGSVGFSSFGICCFCCIVRYARAVEESADTGS